MSVAEQSIENYINGNLTDAKKLAKRVPQSKLFSVLMDDYGKGWEPALAIARYLKGEVSFQTACDIESGHLSASCLANGVQPD